MLLLTVFLLLPVCTSCLKDDPYGTLHVTVYYNGSSNKEQIRLAVYPHSNIGKYPVFSMSYNSRSAKEKVRLSPGDYVVMANGKGYGFNIYAGEDVNIKINLD